MNTHDTLIADTTRRIFRDLGDPQSHRTLGTYESRGRLWNALQDAGLTRAWLSAELNGGGASLSEGFEIARICGEFAVAVPLAETLLASWLLGHAQIPAPDGPMTVAPISSHSDLRIEKNETVTGIARRVPFANEAEHIVVAIEHQGKLAIALLASEQCEMTPGKNIARDSCDQIILRNAKPLALVTNRDSSLAEFIQLGAVVRALQMSGALEAILDRSVAYANERVAFEKPIGRFQAIQHNLARLAAEVAAALASSGSAADAIVTEPLFNDAVFLEVASAKIRVGEAVTTAAAIAHQVHGAIGFSQEHVLHRYTQRLWSWRDDFDSESIWARRLGEKISHDGAAALWPMLAAR